MNFKMKLGLERALPLVLFGAIAVALQGCVDVAGTLNVGNDAANPLVLLGDKGKVTIPPGDHPIQVSVATHEKDESELDFTDLKLKFKLHLPDSKRILGMTDAIKVSPQESGQPVLLQLSRVTDFDTDHYTLSFLNSDGSATFATAHFDHKGDTDAFDSKSNSFLLSYQNVARSRRAAVIPIDGEIWPEAANFVVNHSAQFLLAPWVYARYSNVQWMVGSDTSMSSDDLAAEWKDAIQSSPVVDYFAFNHAYADKGNLSASSGWKKNQLRFVYTEGCGSAGYIQDFVANYNAAVVVGHRDTSASPFFGIPLVHYWSYGQSVLTATATAWDSGRLGLIGTDLLTFTLLDKMDWSGMSDMVRSSEPGIGWTPEMTPDKLNIDQSAVLNRDTPAKREFSLSFIGEFGKDTQTTELEEPDSASSFLQ